MRAERKWRLVRFIITAAALFGVWLIFSPRFELYSLLAGGIGALIVAAFTYEVFLAHHQASIRFFVPNPLFFILYFFLVIYYLYAASFRMLAAVVTRKMQPRIVHFRTSLHSDLARMTLANSITLTPGTITVDLNDDHLTVHWSFCTTTHSRGAGEKIKGRMEKVLHRVWR
jgi:multicomponent Na+:H+ antiporter subunit E